VSERLGTGPAGAVGTIFGRWQEIVGPAIASHVRPLRLEGDTIVVGADHPAWATQIRQLAPEILARVRDAYGQDDAPVQLKVRVLR
jgi:predicted nucleic acid-binding Zn ribbon protein